MAPNRYLNKDELALFNSMSPIFNQAQMEFINKRTPPEEIEEKIENGKKFKTVKSSYVQRILTVITGGNYSFEIKNQKIVHGIGSKEISTEGRLTIWSNGREYFREQCGTYRGVICGDGFKASASDAEKKCASKFGICWDIYTQEVEQISAAQGLLYPDQKIVDRLKGVLSKCTNEKSLDDEWLEFENNNKVLEIHKDIYKEHYNRIIGT